MARYREKDVTDLRWNNMRRRITKQLDLEIAEWREDTLNKLLGSAWKKYAEALTNGDVVELEAHYEKWVALALDEAIGRPADAAAVTA